MNQQPFPKPPRALALSDKGTCVAEYAMSALKDKKHRKAALPWVLSDHHAPEPRQFAEVEFKGRTWWADMVTGGLYDQDTGRHVAVPTMRILLDGQKP